MLLCIKYNEILGIEFLQLLGNSWGVYWQLFEAGCGPCALQDFGRMDEPNNRHCFDSYSSVFRISDAEEQRFSGLSFH